MPDDFEQEVQKALGGAGQPPQADALEHAGHVSPDVFLNPTPGMPTMAARPVPRPANLNTSQAQVKQSLPPPKAFMDRIWDNYAKNMTPEEFLKSEPAWSGAARLSEAQGISESEAFAQLANEMFSRMGANHFMTPQTARKFMGQERGIKPVEAP